MSENKIAMGDQRSQIIFPPPLNYYELVLYKAIDKDNV